MSNIKNIRFGVNSKSTNFFLNSNHEVICYMKARPQDLQNGMTQAEYQIFDNKFLSWQFVKKYLQDFMILEKFAFQ